ncbi:oxidoreductase [Methylobacterium haplocladii]|uniref:Short-chain dehydrogenase/reductase n=1 Tax=Methylobacterium haplocladii TaxID=1176176 RepID=A0A512IN63_9HYPH|nr:oxidoreductase [Methylobacterium haplocladii]GEO99139.1 short-chain dehydrogenase/reductase [Methylobacterium haplocladii]GJD83888.1 3-phenylpropionate-dihydrodiol/cinnamic acid-dihydrodiol dehydrogenase [Methylobacterium haplocladii]GLS58537.1 short-chain dehydrogenase/reductase [Methylobacterium haplocladii]
MTDTRPKSTRDRVALITGAASGIGLAIGVALVRKGFRVFGTSRQAQPGEVRQGIHMLRCDVIDDTSVTQTVAEVLKLTGRIDVLVNNAGRSLIGGAEESSLGQARDLFDINVFGIVRTTNAVLPTMRSQRSGRIINISSVAGFLPGPYTALYSATKHAVEGYSESLDHELRSLGIRVSLVAPAFTRTDLENNADKPDRVLSVYDKGRQAMISTWQTGIAAGDPVEAVADQVVLAATDSQPNIRYMPGKTAGRLHFMRRYVPEKAFEKSFRKQMGVAD